MRPIWLIEAGVYGDEIVPLLDEIRRQGMLAGVVPYQSLIKGAVPSVEGRPVAPDACVIAYGTFPFARQVQLHHRGCRARGAIPRRWTARRTLPISAGIC